ncbi:hypothetical protein L6164_028648 [Bauhinia variegata]|uniref:Uncharacterized protein n=1 Tax=Bauhinia variegata TaxID=167791 RepID=A0ACB9L6V3_BAUVA|nr:hypothetical protein L6164_028648 [Bauhinia variegata]
MNQLQAAGIKPDGKAYDWVKITDAIKKATGNKDGYLTCENDTSGQLQLSEIRICFEADAVNLKNCGRKPPVKCRNDLVFASPPPPKSLDTSMKVNHTPNFFLLYSFGPFPFLLVSLNIWD